MLAPRGAGSDPPFRALIRGVRYRDAPSCRRACTSEPLAARSFVRGLSTEHPCPPQEGGENTEPPTQEVAPGALESQAENPHATVEEAEEEEAPQTGACVCTPLSLCPYEDTHT